MARYELRVKPSVAKDLRGIPQADVRRILERIEAPRNDPRAPGREKLAGGYAILDAQVIVEVVRVGRRGEVYRSR
jgi:mRNA interferase RelE/StbE